MLKTRFLIPVLVISVLLASCASAPPEDTAKPDDTVVVEPAKPADRTMMLQAKTDAETARQKATDAKAPRAAEVSFNAAVSLYDTGLEAEQKNDYELATSTYNSAAEGFTKAAEAAEKARVDALAAMKAADEAIQSTEDAAEKAMNEVEQEEAQ